MYFPLVDHLVQERNYRLLSQENLFLGQYRVPAKLNAFNSGVQHKFYETYKTDLSEKRDFDNEMLRWQTKWSHSTDEKPVTLTGTVHSSTLIRTFIPTWSQLLLSSWQCQWLTATPERSFSTMRRVKTYLLSTKKTERLALMHQCLQRHTHWCRSRDSRILRQKEQTFSFRISLRSTNISDMIATNVSLVRSLSCCCCWPQPQLAGFC